MVSSPYYDNPYWEFHLPINPAPDFDRDVDFDGEPYEHVASQSDLGNWFNEGGELVYRARLPIGLDAYQVDHRAMTAAGVDDAPELDEDYEYDCD